MAKNNSGMTPGSRMVSGKAMKSGVKAMDKAKAQASWKTDAATLINTSKSQKSSAQWTQASLIKAAKEYQAMLSKAAKTGGKVNGMTKNQISDALSQIQSKIKTSKGK